MIELGNTTKAIPYYAVYKPGEDPIHFAGNFLTPQSFLDKAQIKAGATDADAELTNVSGDERVAEVLPLGSN